jgi:hypothetical protein
VNGTTKKQQKNKKQKTLQHMANNRIHKGGIALNVMADCYAKKNGHRQCMNGTKNQCKRNIKMLETYGKYKEFKVQN